MIGYTQNNLPNYLQQATRNLPQLYYTKISMLQREYSRCGAGLQICLLLNDENHSAE